MQGFKSLDGIFIPRSLQAKVLDKVAGVIREIVSSLGPLGSFRPVLIPVKTRPKLVSPKDLR